MKKITALSCCFVIGLSVACADDVRRITLDGKDGAAAPAAETGKDGLARISVVETPQLMLFPAAKKPSQGTLLVSPGGGYNRLAFTHEGVFIAKMLNDAGWDTAVLLYRVGKGASQANALSDAKQALELIQKRGSEFGLEIKKIGAMGFSAGGHLTARLANETEKTAPPDFIVLMYPAYLEQGGKLLKAVVPPNIPIFVYVAANDGYKNSSIALDAYCREKGLKCEYHLAESGGHGFGLKNPLPDGVKDWPDKLRTFLQSVEKK
jgi:acetyl esterase/lipase